ncbi:mucin-15 [Heterocephalus glaber]|uniref:Mucin-15 n=1 Tax=Heterocephalus glaber TaxID=10181 RepID=A0AAX6PHV6_HETGA|nr:mucin-15 [Heterocephalus glaber]XP_004851629.1 mucin-15 [Heterocephalus glaber]
MWTLAQIVLISILFISLPFESHEIENLGKKTTQRIAEVWKTKEREAHVNSNKENGNVSIPKVTGFPPLDPSNVATFTNTLTTVNFSRAPRSTARFSTTPPLIHSFVSKLPWNSSLAEENLSPVSAHPDSTQAVSSEDSSLDNGTMYVPDNSSTATRFPPPVPTPKSVTPLTAEPTAWPTTDGDSFAGFTPYQEKTTLQPTFQFTNDSKLSPSTADPPEENRNTGVVFGAILGAILGVSLLSLVGYLLCGKRKTDSFSHRRLYDDRNEPVLRLDNAPEPYDMGFGSPSYYNPSLNASSVPESRESAGDSIPMDDIPPLRSAV